MPTSWPSEISVPKPNLLTVKAIAPNAASGAIFIVRPMIQNSALDTESIRSIAGRARSPIAARPNANSTEKNSTCNTSPPANALIAV